VCVKKSLLLVRRQTFNTNLYLSKSLSHEHRSETLFNINHINPSKLSGYLDTAGFNAEEVFLPSVLFSPRNKWDHFIMQR
jgi:hypothetical protein